MLIMIRTVHIKDKHEGASGKMAGKSERSLEVNTAVGNDEVQQKW